MYLSSANSSMPREGRSWHARVHASDGLALAIRAARPNPLDPSHQDEGHNDHHRRGCGNDRRQIVVDIFEELSRNRLALDAGNEEGDRRLIEGSQKGENRAGRDPRSDVGQHHMPECLGAGRTAIQCGEFEGRIDRCRAADTVSMT